MTAAVKPLYSTYYSQQFGTMHNCVCDVAPVPAIQLDVRAMLVFSQQLPPEQTIARTDAGSQSAVTVCIEVLAPCLLPMLVCWAWLGSVIGDTQATRQ